MDMTRPATGRESATLARWGLAAVGVVFVGAGLNFMGWASGVEELTRVIRSWPATPPWTSVLLALLGIAIVVQAGRPSAIRVGVGCAAAAVAGVLAVVFLAEYATNSSFGLDAVLFADAVRTLPDDFPGRRPSLQALLSVLTLSIAIGLLRVDRRWSKAVWALCLAAAVISPIVVALANLFGEVSLKGSQANPATAGVSLLIAATLLARPDRYPVAWLLARPDRWPLVRLVAVLAGLPIVVGLSRLVFLIVGLRGDAVWVLSIAVGTIAVGAGAFYVGQREQRRLLDKEQRSSRRAEAERERFEAVLSNAPSAISVRDRRHRYTVVNQAFCQLFGKSSVADVIGRAEDEILPPEVVRSSLRAEERLLAGENFFEEESIRRGSENITVMTQRFALRDSDGAITELVTFRTDITHRKKALQELAEQAMWEERIRSAIADGRLVVYSQPIVDIATRQEVAEELLVRLRADDKDQILAPSDFLPHCERHHLMPVVDRYMVGRAIELARVGRSVNVNISGQTIGDATTMKDIFDTLTTAGPAVADKIVFEITETTAVASPAMAKAFSLGMTRRGCRVVLDDFGTGYGSFTELRHLVLYSLKIDQSFVRNMLEDRDDERAVNTIVYVAKVYGLTAVAEGVESEAVLEKLGELGVDRAQGYLFGKPEPVVW